MNESFRLGRIAGVNVGVNWSLLVIFVLVATGLGAGRFPEVDPDAATWAYVVAAVVTAGLFFASVLAHEIGHAVMARRYGVEVEGITLWLFGGVARLSGEADTPEAEFRIAAIGPAISVAVAVVSIALYLALDAVDAPALLADMFLWLGVINGILAVFNLLPGAPLDGGRVLRAFLWRRYGDRFRASASAARAGRVLGFALIGLGIFQFFAGAGIGGLWLALIGWFLVGAAGAEEAQAQLRGSLGDVRVREVMTRGPVAAPAGVSVAEFLEEYVFRQRFSTFPVQREDGTVVGLVTLNRLKSVPAQERARVPVERVARPIDEVPTGRPDEKVVDVLGRMGPDGDGRVLVFEGADLVGIVSPTDVMRLIEHRQLGREVGV